VNVFPVIVATLKKLLRDTLLFSEHASGLRLRSYQESVALAIVQSVICGTGDTIVVLFPRQSGKNELQAQVETYLLTLYSQLDAEIVKVSPTWKPQSLNAMRRLERVLKRNQFTRSIWKRESGYIYRVGSARIFFLSGSQEASIVGATASTLLEVDEAQDVLIAKFDKDIVPMAASTNATRVFWGTSWTSRTLLARELRAAREAEKRDGRQRTFVLTADQVAQEVSAYGAFVQEQIQKLGRNHPMVRTQFFSEEIDSESGMFPARRQALMVGSHHRQQAPTPGAIYALLIDVAGEDEGITGEDSRDDPAAIALRATARGGRLQSPGRDSTVLTIVEIDLATLADPVIKAPTYRVVQRLAWIGVKHTTLYGAIRGLAETWRAQHIVIDATGIGAGLASFLDKAMTGKVIPFTFNSATKSKLGWDFLATVETGRFKDYVELDQPRAEFFLQLDHCEMSIQPGPNQVMKWGVPDGTRYSPAGDSPWGAPQSGELIHDDYILSAALVSVLDGLEWSISSPAVIIRAADPLAAMDKGDF